MPYQERLRIKQRNTKQNWLTNRRNFHAYQGALFRGDLDVVLDGTSTIDPEWFQKARRNHDSRQPHNLPHEARYPDFIYFKKDNKALARPETKDEIERVKWEGFKLEFVKILATGGFGAATLWNATFEDGSIERLVMKLGVNQHFDANEELKWHRRYFGNSHVVQPKELYDIAMEKRKEARKEARKNRDGTSRPKYRGKIFDMKRLNVVALEFADKGDLNDILCTASRRELRFSNKVLWEIWECFVIGLAAVAYQPILTKTRFEDLWQNAKVSNTLNEFLGKLVRMKSSHDVHFDLEEHNILVASSGPGHKNPLFKLHDFGDHYSYKMGENWPVWLEEPYWRARQAAKRHRITPEQYHPSWDDLDCDPFHEGQRFKGSDLLQGTEIAGRYGSWTNLFLAASIMESIITGIRDIHPFRPKEYTTLSGDTTANTYSWRLVPNKYKHIEAGLRDAIIQCRFERPIDRPSLSALLRQIEGRKAKGFEETDEETMEFWQKFFSPSKPNSSASDGTEGERGEGVRALADSLKSAMEGNLIADKPAFKPWQGVEVIPDTQPWNSSPKRSHSNAPQTEHSPDLQSTRQSSKRKRDDIAGVASNKDYGPYRPPPRAKLAGNEESDSAEGAQRPVFNPNRPGGRPFLQQPWRNRSEMPSEMEGAKQDVPKTGQEGNQGGALEPSVLGRFERLALDSQGRRPQGQPQGGRFAEYARELEAVQEKPAEEGRFEKFARERHPVERRQAEESTGYIMRSRAIPDDDDLSDEQSEDESLPPSEGGWSPKVQVSNETSWLSNTTPEREVAQANVENTDDVERPAKKTRRGEPEPEVYEVIDIPSTPPSPQQQSPRVPHVPEPKRNQAAPVRKAKVGKKVSKKRPKGDKKKKRAERVDEYVERNWDGMPLAIQNLVHRNKALKMALKEVFGDEESK